MNKSSILAGTLLASFVPFLKAAPSWIWSSPKAGENETAVFTKRFELPAGELKAAVLTVTCDNRAQVNINGKPVTEVTEWQRPERKDVAKLLQAGANEIRIKASNEGGSAGLLATLKIERRDGSKTTVETGEGWEVAPAAGGAARPAVVIAALGAQPWGDVLSGGRSGGSSNSVVAANEVKVAPGFTVDLIYNVPKGEEGSWVSMTVDPKGRLICGDQYGTLYRLTPQPVGGGEAKVEKLKVNVGGAHGLLYAFDSLYLMGNEKATPASKAGLWRLKDTDGDDQFDKEEFLRAMDGGGEHGPHSVVLSPDGKGLYFCNGNHTKPVEPLDDSRGARIWQEDHLLPRMWDAKGHAAGILAPGGCIYETDPDAKKVTLFCHGFRNEFDIAFNAQGQLFTYDSDMEWDMGTPWYRPTRMIHCVSGADYGWRSGSGKWPTYYPDSLPAASEVGPGSPTGAVFGTGAKFPAKYQKALFANDWTFGTMYALHLKEDPSSGTYRTEREEFVSGKPLPLTDLVINPKDGAMYFAVGGRRSQSGVYRVRYTGTESTAPVPAAAPGAGLALRMELEGLHTQPPSAAAVAKAWPKLAHADRFIRTAARIAIEKQPVDSWSSRLVSEDDSNAIVEGCIALAHVSKDKGDFLTVLQKLAELHDRPLSQEQKLAALRVMQLALLRFGKPDSEFAGEIVRRLEPSFPTPDDLINRELQQILVFLDSPAVVAKSLQLMATAREHAGGETASAELLARNEGYARAVADTQQSRPNRQQFALAWNLRVAKAGWTPELRRQYFSWFPTTKKWRGGNSFPGFIENARKEALANVPAGERAAMDALSTREEAPAALTFTPAKGPGRPYTVDEVVKFAQGQLHKRSFETGRNLYAAAACQTCHRLGADGGGLGPDLTGAGNRYTLRDLLENIIEPSKVISDQYDSTQIEKKDGSMLVGRVVKKEAGKLFVAINPLVPSETIEVAEQDVKESKAYPISMMPPGLLNALNEEEVKDLLAYLLSGGNSGDAVYK